MTRCEILDTTHKESSQMAPFEVAPGKRVSRRVRESIHGINETIMGTVWPETAAAQRARWVKGNTFLAVLIMAVLLAGPPLVSATHDIGLMLLVPFAGLLAINLTGWLFFEETLTEFIASVLFGVASSPRKYVLRAIEKGTVVADERYVRWLRRWPWPATSTNGPCRLFQREIAGRA